MDLNHRPPAYKTGALTAELHARVSSILSILSLFFNQRKMRYSEGERRHITRMPSPHFQQLKHIKGEMSPLFRALERAGIPWEMYVVGGAVRDVLMGRIPHEFDCVVRGIPLERLHEILAQAGSVRIVGKRFGVLKFSPSGSDAVYDIALPRTDHAYATGGYRDVAVQYDHTLPIEEDLKRRDFTVNAIAWDMQHEELVDPFHGREDISRHIIRTVGDPKERFCEDYSRMLRALRFSCQLRFSIEETTWRTLRQMLPRIHERRQSGERVVPHETIAREFVKSICADPVQTMDIWDAAGAIEEVFPELARMHGCPQPEQWHAEGDVWTHTRLCFEHFISEEFQNEFQLSIAPNEVPAHFPSLTLAILFHDVGKPATLKTPEKDGVDRIRFNSHDQVGAEIFRTTAARLRFSSVPDVDISVDGIAWMIERHLLLVHGDPHTLRNTTLERYFFNPQVPGDALVKLLWIDARASVPADGHDTLRAYRALRERIHELQQKKAHGGSLPPPLLDGHAIMQELGIPPGPQVGKLKDMLREAQLRGDVKSQEEAFVYLRNIYKAR